MIASRVSRQASSLVGADGVVGGFSGGDIGAHPRGWRACASIEREATSAGVQAARDGEHSRLRPS